MSRAVGCAVAAICLVASIGLCAAAQAKTYRVFTCHAGETPLGPTIGTAAAVSGWELSWPTLTGVDLNDQCPAGDRFTFRIAGPTMAAGQTTSARWTAAPGTRLLGLSAAWDALSDLRADRGQGTGQLAVATDQQSLVARTSPFSLGFGLGGLPRFEPSIAPARWFELRFTCLDQCATQTVETFYAFVSDAYFDVDDSSPPIGGLTGGATDAQTWSRLMRFGLNGADVGGGLFRAVVELDGADVLGVPLGGSNCRDLAPDPILNGFGAAQPCPLRIDNGWLDVDTSKLPQGQHVVRVLLEDAAGNRAPIFGPVVRNITSSEAIGPGSDPALRGAANGDGASDLARLTAHWGVRGVGRCS